MPGPHVFAYNEHCLQGCLSFEIRDQSWIEKFISLGAKIFSLATLIEGVGRGVGHTFFIVFPFRKGIPRFKGKASYAVSLCPLLYSDPLQYPDTGPGTHTQRHTLLHARTHAHARAHTHTPEEYTVPAARLTQVGR